MSTNREAPQYAVFSSPLFAPSLPRHPLSYTHLLLLLLSLLLLLLLPPSDNSVAVVLTPVQTKQIRTNIHKRNNTKTQYKQVHILPKHPHKYLNTHTHTPALLQIFGPTSSKNCNSVCFNLYIFGQQTATQNALGRRRGSRHCPSRQALSQPAGTVPVSRHCLSQQALSQSAGTVLVGRHSLSQQALSQSAGTVSVSRRCPSQQALSQSAGTVSVSRHCLSLIPS